MKLHFVKLHNVVCVSAILLTASPVMAQKIEENSETIRLSREATDDFKNKKYVSAAQKFTEAAKLASTKKSGAVLIKNAMIAWYSAKNCDKAISSARDFLNRNKYTELATKDVTDAKTVVGKCQLISAESALKADKLSEAEASLKEAREFVTDDKGKAKLTLLQAELKTKKAAQAKKNKPVKVIPKPSSTSTQAIVGWSLVGVGGVTLVATGAYSVLKNGSIDDEFNGCKRPGMLPDAACENRVIEDAEGAQLLSVVGYSLGAAMIIGGVVAVVLDSVMDSKPKETTFYPIVGSDRAGVGVLWSF